MIFFFYGRGPAYADITAKVFEYCFDGERVYIPTGEKTRSEIFGDPYPDVQKEIVMFRHVAGDLKCQAYNADSAVSVYHGLTEDEKTKYLSKRWKAIPASPSSSDRDKIAFFHAQLKFTSGTLEDEMAEQTMTVRFLDPEAKVLELGANIGRNTLMIASILRDERNFVTLECDPTSVEILKNHRFANNLEFKIEPAALSYRKLIQRGWETKPSDELQPGYHWVRTITYEELLKKYELEFDTIVADCEGALYYILLDNEKILSGIHTVILESDYTNAEHKELVEQIFRRYGLQKVYSEPLIADFRHAFPDECVDSFFEVWKRGQYTA